MQPADAPHYYAPEAWTSTGTAPPLYPNYQQTQHEPYQQLSAFPPPQPAYFETLLPSAPPESGSPSPYETHVVSPSPPPPRTSSELDAAPLGQFTRAAPGRGRRPGGVERRAWAASLGLPLWRLPLVWPSARGPQWAATAASGAVPSSLPAAVEHLGETQRVDVTEALTELRRARDALCRLTTSAGEAAQHAPQALQAAQAYVGALEAVLRQTGAERAHARGTAIATGDEVDDGDDVSWLARRMRWPLHERSSLLYWRNEANELVSVNTLAAEWMLATQSSAALATLAAQQARDAHEAAEYTTLAAGALEAVARAAADMALCTPDSAATSEAAYAAHVRLPTIPTSGALVVPLFASERAVLRLAATVHQLLARLAALDSTTTRAANADDSDSDGDRRKKDNANDEDARSRHREMRNVLLAMFRATQAAQPDVVGSVAGAAFVDAVRDAVQAARLLLDAEPGGVAWRRVPELYYSAHRRAERAAAGNDDGLGGHATQLEHMHRLGDAVAEASRTAGHYQTLSDSEESGSDVDASASAADDDDDDGGGGASEEQAAWPAPIGLPVPVLQWRQRVATYRHAFLKQHSPALHILATGELARQQTAQRRADATDLTDGPLVACLGEPLEQLLLRLSAGQHGLLAGVLEMAALAGAAHALGRREARAAGGDRPAHRAASELSQLHADAYRESVAGIDRLLADLLLGEAKRESVAAGRSAKTRRKKTRTTATPSTAGRGVGVSRRSVARQ